MIYLDGVLVENKRFPDGTLSYKYIFPIHRVVLLTWLYDNDEEMSTIYFLVKHIQSKRGEVKLRLPYVPNARMDKIRPNNDEDIFTLKYFADFLNSLDLLEVRVLDVHSDVAASLINNIVFSDVTDYIGEAIETINDPNLVFCFPDEGAQKRYSSGLKKDFCFGVKNRNKDTAQIESHFLVGECVKDKNVLIIDDIYSKGGTSYSTAQLLQKAGAKYIYLYITHCENNIANGKILATDLIDHIYTTDSILRLKHEKITIFPCCSY